jgi:2-keto-4-pentenoate hydratase
MVLGKRGRRATWGSASCRSGDRRPHRPFGAAPRHARNRTALRCIACVHPALEIVDYSKAATGLDAILGHSMFHFASVIGEARPLSLATGLGTRWPDLTIGAHRFGELRDDLVPGDLGALVAFVASYLAACGQALEENDIVLSGSYMAQAGAVSALQAAAADFGPLGSVSVRLGET